MSNTMLDYLRIALYAVLLVLGFFLFQAWNQDHPPLQLPVTTQMENLPAGRFIPKLANNTQTASSASAQAEAPALAPATIGQLVKVTTDVLEAKIDTRGGDVVEMKLLKYPEILGSNTPIILLNDYAKTRYIAESGLLSKQGPDTTQEQALYTPEKTEYVLNPNENTLTVKLNWQKNGIKVAKTFSFARNSYEVKVTYEIENQSKLPWQGNLYTQLMRTDTPPATHSGLVNLATYFGAALSSPQKPFEKITFKQMQEKNFSQVTQDGWVAMIQHYFISAWVPARTTVSTYYTKAASNGLYTVGMMGPQLNVATGAKATTEAKLYTGPAIADQMEKTASSLKLTIDYGWFWFISVILFWMMQTIYDVVGNWGWAIIFVTVIVKIIFYPLSAKSYRSMSGLKKLQPRMEALKERYKDDRQKLTQETLALYKQEKVNPMSGCLPVLIQIPVFIALYWVLVESVQLRQAPFMFWIHDLSQHDPYYILPILMGISMFLQQRLSPPPPDPMQAKIMMLMPIVFTVLFANFPAGLMLYWFVNNTLSFLQQWYIMHKIEKETKR